MAILFKTTWCIPIHLPQRGIITKYIVCLAGDNPAPTVCLACCGARPRNRVGIIKKALGRDVHCREGVEMESSTGTSHREDPSPVLGSDVQNLIQAQERLLLATQRLQGGGAIDERMTGSLREMGELFEADRAYIIEGDEGGGTLNNTYEWCKAGVEPQIGALQGVDFSSIERWAPFFDRHEALVVPDIEAIREDAPDEYEFMSRQNIRSYVEAPIIRDGHLAGFVGVDNPARGRLANTGDILFTYAYSVANALAGKEAEEKLRTHARELEDVVENIPVGVSMIRVRHGRIVSKVMNPLLCDLFGVSRNDAVDADHIAMGRIPLEHRVELQKQMDRLMVPGTLVEYTFPYHLQQDVPSRWYQMWARSVTLGDELVLFSCLSDITVEREAEASLRQSRQIYEAAAELANLGVWVYDIRTHAITISDNGASSSDREEYAIPKVIENVPDSLADWIDPADFEKMCKVYRDVDNGAPSASCDYWYKERPGARRRCERLFYMTVFDDLGDPQYAYGIGMDITSQKVEEERYESLYQQVAKVNPYSLGTFRLNLTKNTCTGGTSPYETVLAQKESGTADGYLAKNASIIIDDDLKRQFGELFSREALLDAFRAGKSEVMLEYPIRSSTGRIIWIDGFVNMIQNPMTHDIEAVTYALDVTGRKTEESIVSRITEDKYDFIALIDPSAKTFELRRRGWEYSPLEPNTPVGYDGAVAFMASSGIIPEDRDMFQECASLENVTRKMGEAKNFTFAYRCLDGNGDVRRKQSEFSWLDSSRRTLIVAQSDVTAIYEQEQLQMQRLQDALRAAEEANSAKSDFLSRMSHDIRTPLNGIIGMTYLAQEQETSPQVADYLKKIDTSSKFLLGLINDVLDMSKAESGKLELHPEPYDPPAFFGYLDAVIVPLCEEKHQRLVIEPQMVSGIAAVIDPLRINQVFFNLLSNAVKFTPEGGTITFRLSDHIVGDGQLDFTGVVQDSGIGMSQEFQKVLFQPFTQENRNDVSETRGTGLGLAIVMKIVDAMCGTIEVESEIGKGTTFTVHAIVDCVPVEENQGQLIPDKRCDHSAVGLRGRHVLLCEDHPLNQEIAKSLMEEKGIVVSVADDGRSGVREFSVSSVGYYDAILMDIRMPIMDGYEATHAIRSLDRPDATTVPIIAMTADAFAEDVKKCLDAGMNAHVAKPVDPDDLTAVLVEWTSACGPARQ